MSGSNLNTFLSNSQIKMRDKFSYFRLLRRIRFQWYSTLFLPNLSSRASCLPLIIHISMVHLQSYKVLRYSDVQWRGLVEYTSYFLLTLLSSRFFRLKYVFLTVLFFSWYGFSCFLSWAETNLGVIPTTDIVSGTWNYHKSSYFEIELVTDSAGFR